MEFYQNVQNRTAQTVAVIDKYAAAQKIDNQGAAEMVALSAGLDTLAQTRDDVIFLGDEAVRTEFTGYRWLRLLGTKVPPLIEAQLGDDDPIVDSLSAAYAIVPRTTESALARARALRPVWQKANGALAARIPAAPPITRGGKTLADLDTFLTNQPALEQGIENTATDIRGARLALRTAAQALDRLNKRFYKALSSEADPGTPLAEALTGIDTESSNLPGTLSIKSVLQGGNDQLHALVAYDGGTFDDAATSTIEWQVVGTDNDFTHSVAVDPSGNALGPFKVGDTVKIRTRVVNANGTTTGSVRTITLQAPVV